MLQLVFWFLLAAALGAAFGWTIRSGGARHGPENAAHERGAQLAACEAECQRLRAEVAAAGERIARLEGDLAEAREAQTQTRAEPGGDRAALPSQEAGAQPLRLDAPEGRPDDLQKITGIGPGTERTLNGLGIWHFRQIAELSPDNVAWIDRHLRFKGRIARENWVGQARALATGGETGPERP